MSFTIHKSCVRKIASSDPDFNIIDGVTVTGRACLEISQRCPDTYKDLLLQCIEHGWVKPVAFVRDAELMWDKLST